MTPYYQDDQVTLYHGDCREVIRELAPQSVNLVMTDPPYGMNYDSGWSGASVHLDGTRLCLRMYRELLPLVARIMAPDSHMYWFTRWDVWPDAYDCIAPHVPVRNMLVWDKGHPGMGNLESYGYSFEMAVFASKGHRPLVGGRPNSIFKVNPVPNSQRVHPTEKPIGLLSDWIERSSVAGEVVFDPFAGSGSTLVASRNLGRRAVGVEIEERYCELTAKRLDQMCLDFREGA
ncbi:DNA methyltransferase [Mycobacterium phage Leozinho]|nr:DNA methylase [Mycobacterium phage MadMen]UVK58904.1 DNA methyltransferase [Mycobacterium phage Leozinho]